jgi:Flp pilus assembly protein TadB
MRWARAAHYRRACPPPRNLLDRERRDRGVHRAVTPGDDRPRLAGFPGIFSIIAGIVLLAIPGISLLVGVFLVSAWLILFGLLEISLALRLRSARQLDREWLATAPGAT